MLAPTKPTAPTLAATAAAVMVPAELRLHAAWDGRRLLHVALERRGPVRAGRWLAGRSPAEVLAALPMLYSVCAEAQGVALAAALEAAWGVAPAAVRERAWLVDGEAALELMARDPDGGFADLADQAALRKTWQQWRRSWRPVDRWCGAGERAPGLPPGAAEWADALAGRLRERDLGMAPERFTDLADRDDDGRALENWVRQAGSPAASWLMRHWRSRLAPGRLGWLAAGLPVQDVACVVAGTGDPVAPLECGPLADEARSPAMAALLARRGRRLALRWLARWLALARTCVRLTGLARGRHAGALVWAGRSTGDAAPAGRAWVATARGPLLHEVRADRALVHGLGITAPVDHLAAPGGALVQALAGLPGRDEGTLQRRVARVMAAMDPCLPWRLELGRA